MPMYVYMPNAYIWQSPITYLSPHTHVHTYTHTHARAHTHIHTHTHTHAQHTHTHTLTHTHTNLLVFSSCSRTGAAYFCPCPGQLQITDLDRRKLPPGASFGQVSRGKTPPY